MAQAWDRFTAEDHATWKLLVDRQSKALTPYAAKSFLSGLTLLGLSDGGIPDYDRLNPQLKALTGWEVVAVPGFIPNEPFFRHLSEKRFPVANFLRGADSLDYSDEPDMFHDLFGHIPMLTDPVFSDFLVAYGEAGLRAEPLDATTFLARLYLYTVEFGLVVENGELRAFGAGLLSSYQETRHAITTPEAHRLYLDIPRIMRTDYLFDEFQKTYFVVDSFADLLDKTEEATFSAIYKQIAGLPTLAPDAALPTDRPFVLKQIRPEANAVSSSVRQSTEDGLTSYEVEIGGETIRWDNGLTYARHLQIEQLLSAQVPVSDKPDEMLFIIMHQTMELWLKQLLHEARLVVEALRKDKLATAGKRLDRMATIQRHMIGSWEVLATLTPHDFLTFRGYLRKASGFQSHQYRELEFLLGNKREEMMLIHGASGEIHRTLDNALRQPSLYDELLHLLSRRGFAIPASHLERDWSKPYEPSDGVEAVWLEIYSDVDRHWDLYILGEKVTALEYYFQEWRFKHMKTVARVIGHKPGTGGSSGVNYLVKALDLTFFPELWSMRTRMVAPQSGPSYAPSQRQPA